jgi:serine/threonine-protein kinase
MSQLLGSLFHGRYRVVEEIGVGGKGQVFRAVDVDGERPVALKVLRPDAQLDREVRKRFGREANIAAKLKHTHVAEVYDAGVDEATDTPFIVFELLEGMDLGMMASERGPLPPEEVSLYLWQTAQALDEAHRHGIVHRDLKPANLFVTRAADGAPHVKVIDFGIAKLVEGTISGAHTMGMLGTPLYMAPEQASASVDVSPQTDVYALAHIAYRLLVGEPYYGQEDESSRNVVALLAAILRGLPEPASARARARLQIELPAGFDGWFAKAASHDPEVRFATATSAITSLSAVLSTPERLLRDGASLPPPSTVAAPSLVAPSVVAGATSRLPLARVGLVLLALGLAIAAYWLSALL